MIENKYKVYVNGHLTANNMPLEDAMIYVKAIFETYYNDKFIKGMTYTEVGLKYGYSRSGAWYMMR